MSDTSISNQFSKILNRFDQKLSSSPSYAKTLELLKTSPINEPKKSEVRPNIQTDPVKTLTCLQEIYQSSIGKYLHQPLRSKTPELQDPQPSKLRSTTPAPAAPTAPAATLAPPTIPKSPSQAITPSQRFQPKLNKNSLKIASRLCSSKERLNPSAAPKLQSQDEDFTYHPQINKKSQQISSKKPESKTRWDQLYLQGQDKRKELEKLREANETKEKSLLNCSFKPNILKPSQNTNPNVTIQRLEVWAKNKEVKIKQQKENNAGNDFKECTFMPRITENLLPSENFHEIKGVGPYIERGKKLQSQTHESTTVIHSITRDINKRKFDQLAEALRSELLSIEL